MMIMNSFSSYADDAGRDRKQNIEQLREGNHSKSIGSEKQINLYHENPITCVLFVCVYLCAWDPVRIA